MIAIKYNYYTGTEYKNFLIIPKILFEDDAFSDLSYTAKLVYALLLDRMSLSMKNNWVDEHSHIFIYFTAESIMEQLKIGRTKCSQIYKELEDFGLIIRRKQGLGIPMKIYVMDCTSPVSTCGKRVEKPVEKSVENVWKTTPVPDLQYTDYRQTTA